MHLPDEATNLPALAAHLPDLATHLSDLATHLPNLVTHLSNLAAHLPNFVTHLQWEHSKFMRIKLNILQWERILKLSHYTMREEKILRDEMIYCRLP